VLVRSVTHDELMLSCFHHASLSHVIMLVAVVNMLVFFYINIFLLSKNPSLPTRPWIQDLDRLEELVEEL
jgi:hypothetical protein